MRGRCFGAAGGAFPIIGQGTWKMEADPRDAVVSAIRRGLDLGMTHVDTAEMYGRGRVEEIVGEAIEGRRDSVVLVSKVLPSNATRAGVRRACEASLRRLRTDRLDGYLLHWPGPVPLEETIAGFEELEAEGKIRWWGVSNFDVSDLERAIRIAGEGRIACNQVLYHLEEREIEHEVLPFCRDAGIAVVGYSPFGSGRFPSPRSRGGKILDDVARGRGATPRQLALAFLTRVEPLFTIPKAGRVEHVEEDAGAGDLTLTAKEAEAIDHAFPLGRRHKGLPTI